MNCLTWTFPLAGLSGQVTRAPWSPLVSLIWVMYAMQKVYGSCGDSSYKELLWNSNQMLEKTILLAITTNLLTQHTFSLLWKKSYKQNLSLDISTQINCMFFVLPLHHFLWFNQTFLKELWMCVWTKIPRNSESWYRVKFGKHWKMLQIIL